MRILFAAPDRDLLGCYGRILEADIGETVTAFDGTQVLSLMSSGDFDLAVLDRNIPRIGLDKLLGKSHGRRIPVIVLTDKPVGVHMLMEEPLPCAFLPYPFTADVLESAIRDVSEKAASGRRLEVSGLGIDVSGFRIDKGPSLTAAEINVLESLLSGKNVTTDDGAAISALNGKFRSVGSAAMIRYMENKGFGLVDENEQS